VAAAGEKRGRGAKANADEAPFDESLFEKLKALRRTFADERNVPAFVIFGDATLRAMARDKPATSDEFLAVSGVGPAKLSQFGEAFLGAIRGHGRDGRSS
jgi:ATP-dependent DNA helicase RecQ